MLDSLNELLGPHIFPRAATASIRASARSAAKGQLSLKLGKYGAFIGCSRYPECKYSRVLAPSGAESLRGRAARRARAWGGSRDRRRDHVCATGASATTCSRGRARSPSARRCRGGSSADDVTLEKALKLLALPREVARHPTSGEPILAGIGRYGAYVQHGKTYANLGRDDDVLEIGANRAIDLIVAKESGAGGSRFGGGGAGRELGEHPQGGAVSVKAGPLRRLRQSRQDQRDPAERDRPGEPYARRGDGSCSRRRPRAAASIGRLVGEHPDGGPVTVRDGPLRRLCQLGQGQRDHPEVDAPDSITLDRRDGADRRARGQAGVGRTQGSGEERGGKDRAGEERVCEGEGRASEKAGGRERGKSEAESGREEEIGAEFQ